MFPIAFRRVSVLLLIALSLSLSVYNIFGLIKSWDSQSVVKDYVSGWESRLQSAKQRIPRGTEYVGYIADEDLREVWSPTNGELVEFDLTKYALIPIIVRHGVEYSWVIGNFSSKHFASWLRSSIGTYEIEDLGSGIYLIHRALR